MKPSENAKYKERDYWDERFRSEESYEWLGEWKDMRGFVEARGDWRDARVLVLGCGNSNMPFEMGVGGQFREVVAVDYSGVVINKMKEKVSPVSGVHFAEADIRDMRDVFDDDEFDLVLDKATFDALVVDEGSPWTPGEHARTDVDLAIREVIRVLKPGGQFIQMTFQQPLFRMRYLNGSWAKNEQPTCIYRWTVEEPVALPNLGLGYFLVACVVDH